MRSTFKYLSIIVITYNLVNSQTLSIGLGSGINMIQGNNYYTEDFGRIGLYMRKNGTQTNFAGLGLKNENELALNSKIGFSEYPLSVIIQVHYIPMRGNQKIEMWDYMATQSHFENVTSINDIWSYHLGVRYDLSINNYYSFCNASFLINNWNDSKLQSDYQERLLIWSQYKNGMRYGFNAGFGVGYTLSNLFEIEFESGYNFMNEYSRRDGEAKMNSINISFSSYYTLFP